MAAAANIIGTLRDLDEMFANYPPRRHEVMKTRGQRWECAL
jgi:hypothetical protein